MTKMITELTELSSLQQWHYHKTLEFLEDHGNVLLQSEKDVLNCTSKRMVTALLTPITERLAVPLPTGFGKSTLINQLIRMIAYHELKTKLLVCVATDIELIGLSLDPDEPHGILGTLTDLGVTPETVGVHMSRGYNHGKWDTEDLENKPVLFVTHNRIYATKDYDDLKGLAKDRLVLWDESCSTAAGSALSGRDIKKDIRAYLDDQEHKCLRKFMKLIDACNGECIIPREFKDLRIHGGDKALRMLAEYAGGHATIQEGSDGVASVVYVNVKIPKELNCIIFDASTEISKVREYDPTIDVMDVGKVKRDYSDCKIICVHLNEGKTSLQKPGYIDDQIAIVKEIAGEANPLVLTNISFRGRGTWSRFNYDISKMVKKEIEGAGVITWGCERGVNHFADRIVVANIGITTYAPKDLLADYIAITRNMVHQPTKKELKEYQFRKQITMMHQGFSRSSIRACSGGKVKGVTIIIIHKDAKKFARELKKVVFHKIQIEVYGGDLSGCKKHTRAGKVQEVVVYLENFKGDKVSMKKVKQDLFLTTMTQRQWDGVRKEVLKDLCGLWLQKAQSFVRYKGKIRFGKACNRTA